MIEKKSMKTSHKWHYGKAYEFHANALQKKNANMLLSLDASDRNGCTAFELGCGTGYLTELLVKNKRFESTTAIDISKSMISIATQKPILKRVNFINQSFCAFSPKDQYDAFYSNAAFHWLYPEFFTPLLKIKKMLKPNGSVYIATAGRNKSSDYFDNLVKSIIPDKLKTSSFTPFLQKRITIEQFGRLARKAGFRVEDTFLIEREVNFNSSTYVEWLLSSGGFWDANAKEIDSYRDDLISAFSSKYPDNFKVGHWTTFISLCKA